MYSEYTTRFTHSIQFICIKQQAPLKYVFCIRFPANNNATFMCYPENQFDVLI